MRHLILILNFGLALFLCLILALNESVSILIPLSVIVFIFIIATIFLYKGIGCFFSYIMLIFFITPVMPLYLYFIYSEVNWGWTPELIEGINEMLNFKIAAIICLGALGLNSGSLIKNHNREFVFSTKNNPRSLNMLSFKIICLAGVFLSYLSAPTDNIFASEYGGAQLNSIALAINFPAAYLVSYSFFILLTLDYERDVSKFGAIKLRWLILSIGFIAIFLQFLRGDREILGLFIALGVLYITSPIRRFSSIKGVRIMRTRLLVMTFYAIIGIFFLLAVGILRFTLSHGAYDLSNLFGANPWIMSLTSLAAFFNSDEASSFLFGKTYVQYFLSLPPGFIFDLVGIDRAITATNNLAARLVDSGMTSGGAHVGLVSLSNFGPIGVFLVMLTYSWGALALEDRAFKGSILSSLIWLNLIGSVPIWFWYGEMAGIRALMAAVISFFIFKLYVVKRYIN